MVFLPIAAWCSILRTKVDHLPLLIVKILNCCRTASSEQFGTGVTKSVCANCGCQLCSLIRCCLPAEKYHDLIFCFFTLMPFSRFVEVFTCQVFLDLVSLASPRAVHDFPASASDDQRHHSMAPNLNRGL